MTEIKSHWPADAVEVEVDGHQAWLLESAAEAPPQDEVVRLLGGFDLFLQGRDRSVILLEDSRHKAMWPALGRRGAVLAGGQLAGLWSGGRSPLARSSPCDSTCGSR